MKQSVVALALLFASSSVYADFLDNLKKALQQTAEQTTIQVASDLVRDMIINATTVQTGSEDEVGAEYEEVNGALPQRMTVTAYRTMILPGDAVKAGTKVRVKSYIEVVPGSDGQHAKIEEKLTIWDNEDHSVPLKSMLKEAGESGGIYEGTFVFSLPEGMPQGVYPITTSLMLNGEWLRDETHELQLVWLPELPRDATGAEAELLALRR